MGEQIVEYVRGYGDRAEERGCLGGAVGGGSPIFYSGGDDKESTP